MQRFLRFRTGCHGLPKDIGSQTGVPRRQRLCQLCGADYGDEMHLVSECHGLADLREQIASILQERLTMQQFMWQPDMLQAAKFLDAGVTRMQETYLMLGGTHNQSGWLERCSLLVLCCPAARALLHQLQQAMVWHSFVCMHE